jgi:hypothetical protein
MAIGTFGYEFIVIYKLGKTHVVADTSSKLLNSSDPFRVPNQTIMHHYFLYNLHGCRR